MEWAERIGLGTDGRDWIGKMQGRRLHGSHSLGKDRMDCQDEIKKWWDRLNPQDWARCHPSGACDSLARDHHVMVVPLTATPNSLAQSCLSFHGNAVATAADYLDMFIAAGGALHWQCLGHPLVHKVARLPKQSAFGDLQHWSVSNT